MRILILGGTRFLGRHLVTAALARRHELTLFNRGKTNPELFPEVEKLIGDRDGGLDTLRGRRWDAAIDTCGYVPRLVRASVEALALAVGHYTFISTASVYADVSRPGVDESAPLRALADETTEEVTGGSYGGLKVLCERAAEALMPGRVLTVRSGLIVGPHDPTDRFPYWPRRVAMGGEMLAPGRPDQPVQFIDARDLAAWIVGMAERDAAGIFNATGPRERLTMGEFLEVCREVTGSDADFVWVGEPFLKKHEVVPYTEMPLWIPEENPGFNTIACERAQVAGLSYRPLPDTVRDTLEWDATRPDSLSAPAGFAAAERRASVSMRPEREQDLLRAWREETHAAPPAPPA